jgi:hypothetical protein
MKKWNVRSYKQGNIRGRYGALPEIMVHHEVILAQIKTEALNRFYEKHPEDKGTLRVTASPLKVRTWT